MQNIVWKLSLYIYVVCAFVVLLFILVPYFHSSTDVFSIIYRLSPLCAVVIYYWRNNKIFTEGDMGETLGLSWWWSVILFPLILMYGCIGVSLLFPDVHLIQAGNGHLNTLVDNLTVMTQDRLEFIHGLMGLPIGGILIFDGLLKGGTVGTIVILGEELIFRGILIHQLKKCKFWKYCIITGIFNSIWKIPLRMIVPVYQDSILYSIFIYGIFELLLTPFLVWLRLRSGSTTIVSITHGVILSLYVLTFHSINGGSYYTVGLYSFSGLIALSLLTGVVFFIDYMVTGKAIAKRRISSILN